jgi:hypothetical protein
LGTQTVSFSVRNIGPVSGSIAPSMTQSIVEIVDDFGHSEFTSAAFNIEPGAEVDYAAQLVTDECEPLEYWIAADADDNVDEFDEENNSVKVTLSSNPSGVQIGLSALNTDCYENELAKFERDLPKIDDKLDAFDNPEQWGGDRASSDDFGPNFLILDQIDP